MNVERWPEWTPSVTAVERLEQSAFGIGSRVRVRQPKLKALVWQVSEFQPGHRFTWEARSVGIYAAASHAVSADARGGSTVTLSIDQKGWLAWLLNPFISNLTRRYVEMEAQGLKKHCEEFARVNAH